MSIAKELLNLVNEDENNRLEKKLEDNEYFELNDILQSFKKENAKEVVKENIKEVLDREGFSFKDIEVRIEKITESALLAKVKITLKDGTVFNGNVVSSIQVSDDEEEYEMVDLQLGTEDFSYFGESNQSSFSFHGNKEEFDSRMRDLAEKTNTDYDGHGEKRLFVKGKFDVDVEEANEKWINDFIKEVNNYSGKGNGFTVEAMCDASGFHGEGAERNYIQVYAEISDIEKVNLVEMVKALNNALDYFEHFDLHQEHGMINIEYPSIEEDYKYQYNVYNLKWEYLGKFWSEYLYPEIKVDGDYIRKDKWTGSILTRNNKEMKNIEPINVYIKLMSGLGSDIKNPFPVKNNANESSSLSILAMTEDIMSLMNKVEKQKGKMFYQLYPKLEDEIFAAIDSKNMARLNEIIKKLEDILNETINYSEEKNDMSLASEVLAMCNESDPSLKAPKKWWDKMQKSAMKQYKDEETARKVVGKIWTNLSDEKKEEIRGREGKHYGPAPECKESNNEIAELDKLQSELRLMREKTPVNKMSDEEYKKYKELADKVDKLIKDLYTVQSISKEKNVNETGEMSQADIEEEGEWYGVRLALETLCKDAGLKCKVKPFDQYQGCYAQLENGGKIWLGREEGEYILELGKDTFEFSTADELEDLVKKENENMQSSLDKKLKELEDKKENNKTSKE